MVEPRGCVGEGVGDFSRWWWRVEVALYGNFLGATRFGVPQPRSLSTTRPPHHYLANYDIKEQEFRLSILFLGLYTITTILCLLESKRINKPLPRDVHPRTPPSHDATLPPPNINLLPHRRHTHNPLYTWHLPADDLPHRTRIQLPRPPVSPSCRLRMDQFIRRVSRRPSTERQREEDCHADILARWRSHGEDYV